MPMQETDKRSLMAINNTEASGEKKGMWDGKIGRRRGEGGERRGRGKGRRIIMIWVALSLKKIDFEFSDHGRLSMDQPPIEAWVSRKSRGGGEREREGRGQGDREGRRG